MQIIMSKNSIILKEKVKLNVSVTKHKPKSDNGVKKSVTYKLNVPKIMLDPIYKRDKTRPILSTIENKRTGYEIFGNPFQRINRAKNIIARDTLKIIKNKTNYSITLPRNVVFELLEIDDYIKSLDDIKQRKEIYVYLRLKIRKIYEFPFIEFSLKFNREWSGNCNVKQIKRAIKRNPNYFDLMASKLIMYNDKYDINEILKFKDMKWQEV